MSEDKSRIAVVGGKESVLGFKAVGFDVFEVKSPKETEDTIHSLAAKQYGIIFVTEQAIEPVMNVINEYKDEKIPAIIPIPGKEGSLGIGLASVGKSVERAVGADILKEK